MVNIPLIKLLADGRLHSGQDLAGALGISRTAVWKQLSQLEEQGMQVSRTRGQGYCLARPLDLLESDQLWHNVPSALHSNIRLHLVASLSSTNDYLSHIAASREPFTVCIAEQQTAGKGRRGRVWQSPFARNLYMSIAFDSTRGVAGLDGLSLVIGLAVVKSLASLGVEGLAIKWPNDIWLKGQKLAGILVELSGELQTRCRVVVGLGVNVYMEPEDEVSIDQPWTSLAQTGAVPEGGRNRLAGHLLTHLVDVLQVFDARGFSAFRSDWEGYDALQGCRLSVVGQAVEGVGAGIDERGAYRLLTAEGEVYLNAGEVSIRANDKS